MNNYRIGKLNITSEFALSDSFEPFRSDCAPTDIYIEIADDTIDTGAASFHVTQEQCDVWKLPGAYAFRYNVPETETRRAAELIVDDAYSRITVMPGCGQEYLIRLALECRMVKEGCISLHSSCIIAPDGRAICMTGKSGIGKSTRAAAWKRAMGLEPVSGDRPFIDVTEMSASGAPWDGKEGLHKALSAPMGCILNIVRADGTEGEYELDGVDTGFTGSSVRVLDKAEAFKVVIAQAYMPMWDTDLAAEAMVNLKRLCDSVKVLELVSGPDERSALDAWEAIKRSRMPD